MSVGALLLAGLLLPMAGFLACRLYGPRNRRFVRVLGPGTVGVAFLVFVFAAIQNGMLGTDHVVYHWLAGAAGPGVGLQVPSVSADLYLDPLSAVMTLVITGVGFLILVYAVGYMAEEGDDDFARFFAHMNLFVFSMLLLVLARNFVFLTIGWALVGLSSYLLIGFYRDRPAAAAAARKAFVMNVIGDVGIVLASFVAFQNAGSLTFDGLFQRIATTGLPGGSLELIGFLLLVGAVAKSAQLPLHTWLPDAMEGPTPVSALIHAATMVTAGVYLVGRFHPVYAMATNAAATAAAIGATTALMAALVAVVQVDIKRVLAYSTMSQVGYMLFAVAIGADAAGLFHLVSHAFFKALLFLSAGSVIHALHGEQDMRRMGGLWKSMPVTGTVFLIGSLALAGIPPLAGFFSKDEIVAAGFASGPWHPLGGVVLMAVAGLTAFYMLRAFWLTFMGEPETDDGKTRAHEPPRLMAAPVLVLCVLSVLGGFLQPGPWHLVTDYTRGVFGTEAETGAQLVVSIMTVLVVLAGIGLAYAQFGQRPVEVRDPEALPVLGHAFYWDRVYQAAVVAPLWLLGEALERAFEHPVAIGVVDGVADFAVMAGAQVRRLQSGYVRSYAMVFAAAALVALLVAGVGLR
jgi:NADH-quinone oxidoreductase subunit L